MPFATAFTVKNSPVNLSLFRPLALPTAFIFAGMLLSLFARDAFALSLDEITARVQDRYETTIDFKADFTQETTLKSMNRTEREAGVFYFKNPRRMVWDYKKPKPKKLVINAEKAWFYLPGDNAVYVQDSGSVYKSKTGMRFLSGMGKLTDDFNISFDAPDRTDRDGNYLLMLVPKEKGYGVGNLYLTVDRDNFHIEKLSFVDTYGNATRLYFRNVKVNNNLPEEMFTFAPPAGADIYHNP